MDKHIIGENAGRVWRLLSSDDQRRWEYSEIKDILGLNDAELGSAIGWLAREDKIQYDIMAIISESSMRIDIGKDTSDFLEE